MRIAIGADHGGYRLKQAIIPFLTTLGHEVADLGTHSPARTDYPPIGARVATAVASGAFDRGLLLCKSGIGIAIVANKIPGIRAAVCRDRYEAEMSRRHNDANVFVGGAETTSPKRLQALLRLWLATPFDGGRHQRRVNQIRTLERTLQHQPTGRRGTRARPARGTR